MQSVGSYSTDFQTDASFDSVLLEDINDGSLSDNLILTDSKQLSSQSLPYHSVIERESFFSDRLTANPVDDPESKSVRPAAMMFIKNILGATGIADSLGMETLSEEILNEVSGQYITGHLSFGLLVYQMCKKHVSARRSIDL